VVPHVAARGAQELKTTQKYIHLIDEDRMAAAAVLGGWMRPLAIAATLVAFVSGAKAQTPFYFQLAFTTGKYASSAAACHLWGISRDAIPYAASIVASKYSDAAAQDFITTAGLAQGEDDVPCPDFKAWKAKYAEELRALMKGVRQ